MKEQSTRIESTAAGALAVAWGLSPRVLTEMQDGDSPNDLARSVVADKLARMIHVGLLESGDLLPSERDLCEVFRVARQTVRAAFAILEGRLMISISHGRRSRVLGPGSLGVVEGTGALKRLRDQRTDDVFDALIMVDAQIASLAVKNVSADDLRRVEALVALVERMARDPLCYQMLDYEIRTLLYKACGNNLLANMAMDFYGHTSSRRRQLFSDPMAIQRNSELHVSLLEAMRQRDERQVALIMKEQVEDLASLPESNREAAVERLCIEAVQVQPTARPRTLPVSSSYWPGA